MYKRVPAVFAAVVVMLAAMGGICVCAEPALSYTLVYDACHVHGDYRVQTADGTPHSAEVYSEYTSGDPESAEVQALVNACRDQVTAAMEGVTPAATVYDRAVLTNGAVHTAPAAYASQYQAIFGGAQTMALGSATLTVTDNGAGALQLQVGNAPTGEHTAAFSAEPARNLAVNIECVQTYHAHYVQQGTTLPAGGSYNADAAFDSLDAALAHCEANADTSHPILIKVLTDYAVHGKGTVGDDFLLTIVYGNTDSSAVTTSATTATTPTTTRATTARATTARATTVRTTARTTARATTSAASTTASTSATSTSATSVTTTSTTAVQAVVAPQTTAPRGATVSPPSPFAWDVVLATVVMLAALAALAIGLYIKHRS